MNRRRGISRIYGECLSGLSSSRWVVAKPILCLSDGVADTRAVSPPLPHQRGVEGASVCKILQTESIGLEAPIDGRVCSRYSVSELPSRLAWHRKWIAACDAARMLEPNNCFVAVAALNDSCLFACWRNNEIIRSVQLFLVLLWILCMS